MPICRLAQLWRVMAGSLDLQADEGKIIFDIFHIIKKR
jgi:hypothetical protein